MSIILSRATVVLEQLYVPDETEAVEIVQLDDETVDIRPVTPLVSLGVSEVAAISRTSPSLVPTDWVVVGEIGISFTYFKNNTNFNQKFSTY